MTNNAPQHTPGPWTADGYTQFFVAPDEPINFIEIRAMEDNRGGSDWHSPCYIMDDGPEAQANAHLIATAPEMLEALKVALQADQNQANHGYYRRIIAKAEGKK